MAVKEYFTGWKSAAWKEIMGLVLGSYMHGRFSNETICYLPSLGALSGHGYRQLAQGISEVSGSKISFPLLVFRCCSRLVTFYLSCPFKFPLPQQSPSRSPYLLSKCNQGVGRSSMRLVSPEELSAVFRSSLTYSDRTRFPKKLLLMILCNRQFHKHICRYL